MQVSVISDLPKVALLPILIVDILLVYYSLVFYHFGTLGELKGRTGLLECVLVGIHVAYHGSLRVPTQSIPQQVSQLTVPVPNMP